MVAVRFRMGVLNYPQSLRDSPEGMPSSFLSAGRPICLSVFRFAKYPARASA